MCELLLACESMGFAKRYFKSKSHSCKVGGTSTGKLVVLVQVDFSTKSLSKIILRAHSSASKTGGSET